MDRSIKTTTGMTLLGFIAAIFFCLQPMAALGATVSGACSQGTGIPPFLSSGADPNLLLILDNSGSMLDEAYIDANNECFDETYDTTLTYAGYFDHASWYKWVDGIAPWQHIAYSAGDFVYWNDQIFKAMTAGTSVGANIYEDTQVEWEPLLQPEWESAHVYHAMSFIFDSQQYKAYYTILGGTSAGTSPTTDTGVTWVEINAWQNATLYAADTYVRGLLNEIYHTVSGGTSNGTKPLNDTGVVWQRVDYNAWSTGIAYQVGDIVTADAMVFKAAVAHTSSGSTLYDDTYPADWTRLDEGYFEKTTETAALSFCSTATGTEKDTSSDICITLDPAVAGTSPGQVTAFAAKGNLLNWAMSSKFDIQKNILTGGKYNSHIEHLISENRGCAGSAFIKQVTMDQGTTADTTDDKKLTLSITGPDDDNRIDQADDITRFAIYGVSTDGFDNAACQAAIAGFLDPSGLGPLEKDVEDCVGFTVHGSGVSEEHLVFHKGIQECWYYAKHGVFKPGADSAVINHCEDIYIDGTQPWNIQPSDPAYLCYGIYDPGSHDQREGYVGRCWEPGTVGAGNCQQLTCSYSGDVQDAATGDWHHCVNNLDEWCDGNYKAPSGNKSSACNGNPGWTPYYVDSITDPSNPVLKCTPSAGGTTAGWSTNLDGDPTNDPDDDVTAICVNQAMHDYCTNLSVPEVIDPSDQATTTNDYWNLPAILVDSGLAGQLGVEYPIAVLRGHIKYDLPSEQLTDDPNRPDGPRGVLFDVASQLRLGIMAFNNNGAYTECLGVVPGTIEKYCPNNNEDGAQVISPIDLGMYINDNGTPADPSDDIEVWTHYNDFVTAINGTRATSWTPLAEAFYNALGYYGQDTSRRINTSDFSTVADPVQYWCQSNNILIITEGSSTADINAAVVAFATTAGVADADGTDGTCTDGLEGSTYLDDLTWFGQHADPVDLYTSPCIGTCDATSPEYKQTITTHIVTTGSLRTDGTGECSPATIMTNAAANGAPAGTNTYYSGESPDQLAANLKQALGDIMNRASAGSAASVISSSRTGEGAAYQAIFWPKVPRGVGKDDLSWIGDVHSLFVDSASRMWDDFSSQGATGAVDPGNTTGRLWNEDTNGNGRLDTGEDTNGNNCLDGDRRIFFYYDKSDRLTKICFNDSVRNNPDNPVCDPTLTDYCGSFTEPVNIKDFHNYLWSSEQHLQTIDDANITINRPVGADGKWDWSTSRRRYIFTWNDLNNDGIVDSREILGLEDSTNWSVLNPASDATIQHDILGDFNVSSVTKMNELVNWLRGKDELYEDPTTDTNGDGVINSSDSFVLAVDDINGNGKQDYVYRCRRYPNCDPTDTANNPEWRLGDIIHSTPTLAAQPAEGYHTIYRDPSYAWFVKKYRYRRQVVYFGANDGMMHAVNSGFYNEDTHKFWRNQVLNTTDLTYSYDDTAGPQLGDELWAYVPYNLEPHLKCLSDPSYTHKYFVDQKPRLMDAQIFAEEAVCSSDSIYNPACIHPYGWGTILIGAMRFGGAPVDAAAADANGVYRRFISSYFVLDVTDPERPPELLGEMTMTTDGSGNDNFADLGYTVPVPTGVVMRDTNGQSLWYLVFGNGPTNIKGENNQQGKVAVMPLSYLKGGLNWNTGATVPKPQTYDSTTRKAFRIPNAHPGTGTGQSGNDGGIYLIPDDNPPATSYSFTGDLITVDYNIENQANADLGAFYKSDAVYFGTVDGTGFAPYDIAYPEVTHWNGEGRLYRLVTQQIVSGNEVMSTPPDWYMAKFLDVKAPITAAPALGWDGDSFWVYFGTGRFFDKSDKTDYDDNYFFGVKEPVSNPNDCNSSPDLTWAEINWWDSFTGSPFSPDPSLAPGSRGLFRADHVLVANKQSSTFEEKPYAFCEDGSTSVECGLGSLGLDDLTQTTPDGRDYYAFDDMRDYIAGQCDATTDLTKRGIDGWYRIFRDARERNIGQSTLLGGLATWTTYQPSSDICTAEGESFLYGVHFQTGTAWYENVFGTYLYGTDLKEIVKDKLGLGQGLATTPSMHVGTGDNAATAIVQTSTGEIVEIGQENLPIPPMKSGKTGWTDSCN